MRDGISASIKVKNLFKISEIVDSSDQFKFDGKQYSFFFRSSNDTLFECLRLMDKSHIHRFWTVSDVGKFIYTPIKHDLIILVGSEEKISSFATFAFLSEEAEDHYLDLNGRFHYDLWLSGENLWVMDLIAPYGEGGALVNYAHRHILPRTKLKHVSFGRRKSINDNPKVTKLKIR